jgi:DNA invertase Pin-like site-specific DNA recombinase
MRIDFDEPGQPAKPLCEPVVAYVRMSTDHQQYSTQNQMEIIAEYARRRNWDISKIYSDEGKSGLQIKGRAALSRLISDVLSKNFKFRHILVYDVSRWGRFQDPDEAAHYEFICRAAGVTVHYCAEPFVNDGGMTSTIAKSFKRAMAGEYSRELSTKVFQGACRLIHMGYKQGGSAIYGLRRMMVDQNGQHKGMLKRCEQKNLKTDRVIFIPGPEAEIEVVRWIFQAFVEEGKGETEIARILNQRGVISDMGIPWRNTKIRYMLQNEKYIGNLVYSRFSSKLRGKAVINPPDTWVRKEQVIQGIVEPELFLRAREIYRQRGHRFTDAELLVKLRQALAECGHLTCSKMTQAKVSPTPATFKNRFGSMVNAYRLIGFEPRIDYSHVELKRRLSNKTGELVAGLIAEIKELGATTTWDERNQILQINNELRVKVTFARHYITNFGSSRWVLRWDAPVWQSEIKPDLTMAVRMDRNNEKIRDYYLLPGMEYTKKKMRLAEQNGVYLDAYRFKTLDYLVGMAARVRFS